jgi:phenylpropionate dioxygenase-like ring-hydroxylating dioxygenase large terminal subunit
MSDLGSRARLARSRAQLPVSAYFDQELYKKEQQLLFAPGPRYVGHQLMVPEPGDFHVLTQERNGRMLVRNGDKVELLSNVCRHRQAIIQQGRGNSANIVCPLHRWTYDLSGNLLGAPYFADNPCLNLANSELCEWRGLLFESGFDINRALAGLDVPEFDFSGYAFDRVEVHECAYNWKTFIEVYLEDYHVAPFHPGLGQFVTCEDLRWEFGPHHSVQTVGAKNELAKPGSPAYRKWHDAVLAYREGRFADPIPKHGAIWLTYYPATMVEWYPHVLVVSTLIPKGPQKTLNVVEFYYPEDIHAFEREFVEAEQAAYWETCAEDDEIALRMDAGRRALMERGEDDRGPYQSPMEDGMQQFHEWYQREMG